MDALEQGRLLCKILCVIHTIISSMLHNGEVEHRASQQDDHHGVGERQDELRRKLAGGAG